MPRLPAKNKHAYDLLVHEEARRNLPVHLYLLMLDQAARTGVMPILDDKGKPTGEGSPLDTKERMDVAKYLIDKVLPDVPKEVYHIGAPASEADALPIDKLEGASADQLRRIANGTMAVTDAEFDALP